MPKLLDVFRSPQEWSALNPVLGVGQLGMEKFSYKVKIGDGRTPWNDLQYRPRYEDVLTELDNGLSEKSDKEFDQSRISSPTNLRSTATVALTVGSAGQFDAGLIEGGTPFLDPTTGKLAMVYVGYDKDVNTFASTTVASVGLATSDDGITWTKTGQIFAASGVSGAPDQGGVTGPVMVVQDGIYHLFYIGLTAVGYEGGERAICHATATSLTGPWTRHGSIITKSQDPNSWRWYAVWHPNLVYTKGKWHLFFNASGKVVASSNIETIGYATADTLYGPWTVDDANSPVLGSVSAGDQVVGDPYVWRLNADTWRMDVYRANSAGITVGAYYATTTDKDFPLGWTHRGQVTDVGSNQGAKPYVIRFNGRVLYYASYGVNIFVNVAKDVTNQTANVDQPWRFSGGAAGKPSLKVGDDSNPTLGTAKFGSFRNTSGNSHVVIGQDDTHMLLVTWQWNATAGAAIAKVETFGGSNALQVQNSAGALLLGGSAGSLGFYGKTPVARTALPAAATDAASTQTLANALRTALINLGLTT